VTTTDDDAAARWAAAADLADGVTDDGLQKRRARILIQIGALAVGSWITGLVIAILFIPRGSSADATRTSTMETQQLLAQLIFVGLGLFVGIAGFVWGKRTGHYITRWRAVASPLNRTEKKSIRRQISGKDQPDREHLGVVVAVARQNRRATLGITPIYAAMVLLAIGTAIGSDDIFVKFLELVVSLMIVAVAVQLVILYRRCGRFIEQHSVETA
jgi:hypothetical protein